MIKIYVDRLFNKDNEGARFTVFESDTLLDCSFDSKGNLQYVVKMFGDIPVELKLTEEELVFINEQLEVKELECLPLLSVEESLGKEETMFSPVTHVRRFRIKEKALEVSAHYFNDELIGFTTPYYCSSEKELKHISLNLKKDIEKKLITEQMMLASY